MTYKTLVLTGLRKGESASLTVGQLALGSDDRCPAYAVLNPLDEKNGQGSDIPLRADLVVDLRRWLSVAFGADTRITSRSSDTDRGRETELQPRPPRRPFPPARSPRR